MKQGSLEKTRIQTTVGIQTSRGLYFGTTDWIKARTLQFHSAAKLRLDEVVELKVELPGGGEWLMAHARVIRTSPSTSDETIRCMARIVEMSTAHRERLRAFLSKNTPAQIANMPSRPIPLHEPTVSLSADGRSLVAKWSDPRAFRRDWALHISRGRLPATGAPPRRRAFMLRIMMPDGFVATFPAEIGPQLKTGWLIRFLVPHAPFARMRAYSESRSAEVV